MKTQDITKCEMAKRISRTGKNSLAVLLAVGLLAAGAQAEELTTPATPPVDPAIHTAHVAAGTIPAPTVVAKGDPALTQQLSQIKAKVAQLEAALAKSAPPAAAAPMPGMAAPAAPMATAPGGMKQRGMAGKAAPAAPMAGMSGTAPGSMKPGGMAGMAAPPGGGAMNMMGMMDKMMGMMDKMMGMNMGGGAASAAAPMAGGGMGMMDDDKMEMGGMGGGAMPAAQAGMSGGGGMGMGDDKMEMAAMMGMSGMSSGTSGAMPQSALPGFPGASHLYHIGATGFFLDHPQHIALTTQQQAALNIAKEQALLAKSTADRAIEQAEQELWTLTAADQPDAAKIEAKITSIGKLNGDGRVAFIRAVGEASKLLTDQQRQSLTGFAPPASTAPVVPAAPAVDPMAGGMQDM